MARPRIVYIHGAGPQEHRAILKRRLDELLFGANQLDGSIMAYYADILNVEPAIPDFLEGIEGAGVPEPDPPEARALDAAFTQRALIAAAADAQAAGGVAGEDGLEGVNLFDPVFTIVARRRAVRRRSVPGPACRPAARSSFPSFAA